MKTGAALLVVAALSAAVASAQSTSPTHASSNNSAQAAAPSGGGAGLSAWDWFSKNFQVRKAFDGGKGESDAGAVGLVAPGNGSAIYWLLDAGIRTTPFDVPLNKKGDLELFGSVSAEWHHMNAEPLLSQASTNKAGPALNAEVWFPPVTHFKVREHVVGKAGLQRNFIKDNTENSVTVALETCAEGVETHTDGKWEGGVRPCAELTYNGTRRLHYYPYVGYEHYGKLAIQSQALTLAPAFDGSLLLVRFQADAYPFNTEIIPGDIKGLVLNFDYSFRRTLDDNADLDSRNLNMLKLGATYFFLKGQVVGVGLTFDLGRSPAVNFVSQRRAVLALRIMTKS